MDSNASDASRCALGGDDRTDELREPWPPRAGLGMCTNAGGGVEGGGGRVAICRRCAAACCLDWAARATPSSRCGTEMHAGERVDLGVYLCERACVSVCARVCSCACVKQ